MRLKSIELRGITCFRAETPVRIDLDAIGPGLVALVGRNGSGKTTLLGSVPASLYRTTPDRPGSLYEYSHGRDAFIETVFENGGSDLKVTLKIDAEARRIEQYLTLDGASLTSGRAAEARVEIERRFGSYELFLASVFASQSKTGDILRMPKGQRKQLFVELLGLSYLETLHEGAKMRRSSAENDLAGGRAVLQALESELDALPELERREAAAKGEASLREYQLQEARKEETEASDVMTRARAAAEQLENLQKTLEGAARELQVAERGERDAVTLPKRIVEEEERQREAINAADPDALEAHARERHAKEFAAIGERKRRHEATIALEPEVKAAADELADLEHELRELEAAEKEVIRLRGDEKAAVGNLIAAKRSHADAWVALEAERDRLVNQSALLKEVPCAQYPAWKGLAPSEDLKEPEDLAGSCRLLADARMAAGSLAALEEPDRTHLRNAEEQRDLARARVAEAAIRSDPVRLEEVAARLPVLRDTAAQASAIDAAKLDLELLTGAVEAAGEALTSELAQAQSIRERIAVRHAAVARESEAALVDARAKLAAAVEASKSATERHGKADKEYSAAVDASELDIDAARERHESAVSLRKQAEADLRTADQQLAAVSGQLEQLREKERSVDDVRARVTHAEQSVGDWDLLSRALGRDGIQALEIDASGPEVARLTNELLEACYGTRFAIAFETLREKKSSDGFVEVFDIQVRDRGDLRSVEALSGGERVIVGEAVGLALSIYNARKSGVRWRTLFRDESAGALDRENAGAYIDMMRKALALGGFEQLVFVAHQDEVIERADARFVVGGGTVRLAGPIQKGAAYATA